MNRVRITFVCLSLGVAHGLVAAPALTLEPQAPLKLSGTWLLNKALSDDPARKMMEGMSAGGGPEGGGRPGGGGGGMGGPAGGGGGMGGPGGGGAGGGGGMSGGSGRGGPGRGPGGGRGGGFMGGEPPLDGTPGGERPQGQAGGQGSGAPPDQAGRGQSRAMGVAASPEFTIDQEGDNLAFRTESNLRLLHTDGEKRKKEVEAGKLEVVAKFAKGALVIESRLEGGGRRKEIYSLQPDGKLRVDFEFEGSGPMPSLKFKLVYDAAPTPGF